MTERIAEPISMVEQISGPEIIGDLLSNIESALAGRCYLLPSDAYAGYAAKISIAIQLQDIDSRRVERSIIVGEPEAGRLSLPVEMEIPTTFAHQVRERSGQEPPSLERDVAGYATATQKRYYTPRGSQPVLVK